MSRMNKREEIIFESDVEPDNDPPEEMGDPLVEVTKENDEAAEVSKSKALHAICEGKLVEAKDHLTAAIKLNPKSALLFASRASIFVKLRKPNAAIRDADTALKINQDLPKGYKARGMARAMLGLLEEAARDLHMASKFDFDKEIYMELKKVESNLNKIKELEAARVLKDGEVVGIRSAGDLKAKMNAASKTSRPTIIYFTATWCGPCRYVSPVFTSFAGKYPKVVFLKVDIDEAADAAVEWSISSIPTFIFVKNCKEVDRLVTVDKNSLESKIAQHAG